MSLREIIEASGTLFTKPEEFGETVTYRPSGGTPIEINALVERNVERDLKASGAAFTLVFELWIAKHATLGVLTINERTDKVDVRVREDDAAARTFRVVQVLGQDPGMWHVEIHG